MTKKKIILSLEARMTSSRLPNKIFKKINDIKIIELLIKRIKKIRYIDNFFIAIPLSKTNNKLANFLNRKKINYFRGSENNVLERIVKGGEKYKADILVRLTCDNPLVDIYMIDTIIKKFLKKKNIDYFSNNGYAKSKIRNMPTGIDIEIIKFKTLKKILRNVKKKYYLTFPSSYIYISKKEKFKLAHFQLNKDIIKKFTKNLRLTLDTKADLIFLNRLFKKVYKKYRLNFNLLNVLNCL